MKHVRYGFEWFSFWFFQLTIPMLATVIWAFAFYGVFKLFH